MIETLLLGTILYPGAAVLLIWGLGHRCGHGRGATWVSAAVGLAAYAVPYLALIGVPRLPPADSLGWLCVLLPGLSLAACLETVTRRLGRLRWLLGTFIAAGCLALLLQASLRYTWTGPQAVASLAGLSVAAVTAFATLDRASRLPGRGPWLLPVTLIVATGTLSLALGASGSLKLAQFAGALTVVLCLHGVLCHRGWVAPLHVGLLLPLWGTAFALLLNGLFYSELPRLSAALLYGLLGSPALGPALRRRGLSPRSAGVLQILVTLGLAVLALAWTVSAGAPPDDTAY